MARQAKIILRASDRLGMSPASRARLQTPDDGRPSKFDSLLGRDKLDRRWIDSVPETAQVGSRMY